MRWLLLLVPIFLFSSLDDRLYKAGYRDGKRSNFLTRSDNIPQGQLSQVEDTYLEGYIQALIDTHYYELEILVLVKERIVYLYNLPSNKLMRDCLISFVRDVPDVEDVITKEGTFPDPVLNKVEERVGRTKVQGIWFPESTVIFPPLIANPRNPNYSMAYRFGSDFLAKDTVAVSLGDFFPIFRFNNVGWMNADLQIDFAACAWTVFNMDAPNGRGGEWARLDNCDYYGGLPISFAFDRWAFRLQFYHISTHLGDEYIVNLLLAGQPVYRVNPSFEVLELIGSYQLLDGLRVYAGPAWVINSDKSYPMGDWYVEYGFEGRWFGKKIHKHRLFGCPFIAVDVQNWQTTDWRFSVNALAGYEWSKLHGVGRKVRIYVQYHNGNSEGQFFKEKLQYAAIGLSWGF
ncbi:MAG: DUF1207 domain-containing protein [Chlamydiia bacterium]